MWCKSCRSAEVWLADITYIWTDEGWLFLAAILDIFSRRIVGWAMDDNMRVRLTQSALRMAIELRQPEPNLLHHSDRGSQYAAADYQALLDVHEINCSMSRKGNCWDNAPMESFFDTLKTELVYQQRFQTREQARSAIFEYIECFYNRERLHSSIDYNSPEEYESMQAVVNG
ncbi:Mobile element protein [hydrothermal vent metagenome]|uniref:Mobile element protein n=1 Tax=hydrothermal vent metagenome TaxID=652676 RepID=A0A3B0Z8W2_9ZZZZ